MLRSLRRLPSRPAAPFLPPTNSGRLTLCVDLDETLVHCTVAESASSTSFMEPNGAEAVRAAAAHDQLHRKHRSRLQTAPDHEIELPYLEEPVLLHKRPQLDDFLEEAAKMCEIVLFTSAAELYATECVELLDPERRLFSAVLTREHCTLTDQLYIKDLSLLGRPLERVVCVDDHMGACMLQPNNAVPVRPFVGGLEDQELPHVLSVLHRLRHVDDVRDSLRGMYNLQENLLEQVRSMRARGLR